MAQALFARANGDMPPVPETPAGPLIPSFPCLFQQAQDMFARHRHSASANLERHDAEPLSIGPGGTFCLVLYDEGDNGKRGRESN